MAAVRKTDYLREPIMRKFFIIIAWIALCSVLAFADFTLDELSSDVVDPSVAVLAAAEYLPCYYPGNWEYFDHEVAYDLEGVPAAYIIIFRSTNAVIKTAEDLRASIKEHHQKIMDAELQIERLNQLINIEEVTKQNIEDNICKSINTHKRASYHTNGFATVITGATQESPIVYRCYLGLPGNFVKEQKAQEWIQKNHPDKNLQIKRLIFLSPLDIRYEVISSEKPLSKPDKKQMTLPAKASIAEDAQLLSFSKEQPELEQITVKREKMQVKLQIKTQQIQQMPEEYRKTMEQGELNRKQHNADKWKEYQNKQSTQSLNSN
jgi:hypothetical protein